MGGGASFFRKTFLFLCAFLCASPSFTKAKTKAKANELVVDFSCPGESHFSWANDGILRTDSFDAESGASRASSTRLISALCQDSSKKSRIPQSIKNLFFFGVSSPNQAQNDMLTVTPSDDGVLCVTYIHRGTVYRITTGESGVYELSKKKENLPKKEEPAKAETPAENLPDTAGESQSQGEVESPSKKNTCEKSSVVAENKGGVFFVKNEFRKEGASDNSLSSLDFEKVTFTNDLPESEKGSFAGKLYFSYEGGTLFVKGKISFEK